MLTLNVAREDAGSQLNDVALAVAKARHIAVVAGAGISCAAGIPDFRSSQGLFQSLKDRNPKAGLTSGKDLFSANLFQSEQNTQLYYQMIADLFKLAQSAEPTAFHRLLKTLDDRGKLFRVYTQNIDALEEKAGLTFGLGDRTAPPPPAMRKKKARPKSNEHIDAPLVLKPYDPQAEAQKTAEHAASKKRKRDDDPPPSPSKRKDAFPRCIPLHGSVQEMSCTKCSHVEPLTPTNYLPYLELGYTVACPSCARTEAARRAGAKRSRGLGMMKPAVVLYGESNPTISDSVGQVTERDLLTNPRPDLVLVVGSSLKVPGTKRLVRELAKVVNPSLSLSGATLSDETQLKTAKVVLVNLDMPAGSQWPGLFDVFVQGDVQAFAALVDGHCSRLGRTDASPRKRATKKPSSGGNTLMMQHFQSAKPLPPVKGPKPSWEYSDAPAHNKLALAQEHPELFWNKKRERKPTAFFEPDLFAAKTKRPLPKSPTLNVVALPRAAQPPTVPDSQDNSDLTRPDSEPDLSEMDGVGSTMSDSSVPRPLGRSISPDSVVPETSTESMADAVLGNGSTIPASLRVLLC